MAEVKSLTDYEGFLHSLINRHLKSPDGKMDDRVATIKEWQKKEVVKKAT